MHSNDEIIAIVKSRTEELDMSMSELSRRAGVAKSSMSRYINKTRQFPLDKVNEFSAALRMSPEELLGIGTVSGIATLYEELDQENKTKAYDYINSLLEKQKSGASESNLIYINSKLSAGTGIIDLDPGYQTEMEYQGQVPKHDLAFIVSGDSMQPVFEDGEVVFVEKTIDIRNGQIIAVQINEEAYIKKVYKENDKLRLVSLNTKYDDIYADENDDIRIVGRVVL